MFLYIHYTDQTTDILKIGLDKQGMNNALKEMRSNYKLVRNKTDRDGNRYYTATPKPSPNF